MEKQGKLEGVQIYKGGFDLVMFLIIWYFLPDFSDNST